MGVYSLPPFIAVCLTNCGKVVYTQFLKTLCIMQTWKRHYTRSYNAWYEDALHLYSDVQCVALLWKTHCTQTYNVDFGKDVLHSDIQYEFLREYYTRTYSKIFDFILYSDIQYDFYTALGRTVRFLYCTRTYNMIFILHSDVQYDFYTALGRTVRFLFCTALGRTIRFLILYRTQTYSTTFARMLYSDV